jgi:hypothetical protein
MNTDSKNAKRARQIVGFSLSPELAREVKAEAAKRGVALKILFEEIWAAHKSSKHS